MSCRVKGKVWLSPTRLCMALSGGQSTKAQQEVVDGFIVVESNYRVRPLPCHTTLLTGRRTI